MSALKDEHPPTVRYTSTVGVRHLAVFGAPPLSSLLAELSYALNPAEACLGSEHYVQLLALCEDSRAEFLYTSFKTDHWVYVASGVTAGSPAALRLLCALNPELLLLCGGEASWSWLSPLTALAPAATIVAWLEIPDGPDSESRADHSERALRSALEGLGVKARLNVVRGCLNPIDGDPDKIDRCMDELRNALDAVPTHARYQPQEPLLQGLPVVDLECILCGAQVAR